MIDQEPISKHKFSFKKFILLGILVVFGILVANVIVIWFIMGKSNWTADFAACDSNNICKDYKGNLSVHFFGEDYVKSVDTDSGVITFVNNACLIQHDENSSNWAECVDDDGKFWRFSIGY